MSLPHNYVIGAYKTLASMWTSIFCRSTTAEGADAEGAELWWSQLWRWQCTLTLPSRLPILPSSGTTEVDLIPP